MKPKPQISTEPSDLWSRFKAGDRAAFEELYERHFPQMYRYGMAIIPVQDIVKDGIQQIFVDLWRYKSNLGPIDDVSLYLLKSLRFKLYRDLKAYNNMCEVDSLGQKKVEKLPSQETIIIRDQETSGRSEQLKCLVNQLPPQQREAVMLIYFEEKSHEEVAALLGIGIQSLYNLIWRSISQLRSDFKL